MMSLYSLIANEIRVILSEKVKKLAFDPAIDTGYFLAPNLTNGRSYWVDSEKKFAIWSSSSGRWHLSRFSNLGNDNAATLFTDEGKDLLPFQITDGWQFYDKNEKSWKLGSNYDIVIATVFNGNKHFGF